MPLRNVGPLVPSDLGIPYDNIFLETSDGLRLSGWFLPSDEGRGTIICVHGYPADKADILPFISFLHPDFSLLLFDMRAHGSSEGRFTYFGLKEDKDVEAALNFISERDHAKDQPIGIWGYSLGGAVGISAASKNGRIAAIVTDSSFASLPDMVTQYFKKLGPLRHLLSPLSVQTAKYLFRLDFSKNSPENLINNIGAPILIIHSEEDNFVPYAHALRLFEKAPEPKEMITARGPHIGLERMLREEYRKNVKDFFIRHMFSR